MVLNYAVERTGWGGNVGDHDNDFAMIDKRLTELWKAMTKRNYYLWPINRGKRLRDCFLIVYFAVSRAV